jgi:putative hydrolase of HD superfamily
MKENVEFLVEVQKLKEMPRTGLVWLGVKNPPSVADHTFRVAISSWIFGEKMDLNVETMIKTALSHDLCEVYGGDRTPFWGLIPESESERKEVLKRWIRLPVEEKKKRSEKEFEEEKILLLKLINFLNPELKKEIFSFWLDYKKGLTKEGKIFLQIDKMEGMLEALENLDPKDYIYVTPWWEEAEELAVEPKIILLYKIIQNRFYKTKAKLDKKILKSKLKKELENILEFILEIGKLKKMPRLYWILRGIKSPETVAGHIFTLAIMAWIFGKERKKLNQEKLLKMALCHELSAVYTGDTTPYDRILPKEEKEREKVLKKMIRLSKKEKKWIFLTDYKVEKKAIEKLIKKLDSSFKKEILDLWHEYRTRSSLEAKFLGQLNILAVLLQGLFYEKEYKEFTATPLWEWAYENCDDEICVSLMEEMKRKFYG